jgi:plastocyanin
MVQVERRSLRILLMALAFLLPVLACVEYPGVPRDIGLGAVGQLPPAVGGGTDSAGEEATFGREVQLELRDFELVPADITVSAGEVTFTLVNAGRFTHDFRVEGEGVDEKSPRVAAGRTDEWSITLAPGIYHISCPISNHEDRGMIGTMTVVPSD